MSSFIGHSIVGLSLSRLSKEKPVSWKWSLWLMCLAISPDLNYLALWIFGSQGIFSYSHSIGFVSILPFLSLIYLKYKKQSHLLSKSLLLFGAAFSHLTLDTLVGVFPKPYLWPFYNETIRLPFGILPSAGKLDIYNIFLYRNLFIELGILLPFIGLIYLFIKQRKTKYFLCGLIVLITIWIPFLKWGWGLFRG